MFVTIPFNMSIISGTHAVKYLGIMFDDEQLSWSSHIEHIVKYKLVL